MLHYIRAADVFTIISWMDDNVCGNMFVDYVGVFILHIA